MQVTEAPMDTADIIFIAWSLLVQVALVIHFALRKWAFSAYTMKYGWIVYALACPAVIVSLILLSLGQDFAFWIGGFLFLAWATYGYVTDYVRKVRWRTPIRWSIAGPYLTLYLATVMFYWWPVGIISRALWCVCATLFVAATVLNLASHHPASEQR
jgi:hypothetical protein